MRTGIHVGVDVLINRLSEGKRKHFITFGLLAGALFTGSSPRWVPPSCGERRALRLLQGLGQRAHGLYEGPTTPDLEWPTWIVYSAIPLGSSLMCFRFLQVAWAFVKTGELPHHDHGHVDGLDDEPDAMYRMDDNLHPHPGKGQP